MPGNCKSTNSWFELTVSIIYGENQEVQEEFSNGFIEFHKKPPISCLTRIWRVKSDLI
jgi:hypothetical protein